MARLATTTTAQTCLVVLILFNCCSSIDARELKMQEVRAAVQTWVRYKTADAKPDAVIKRIEPHIVDGEKRGYIAHIEGGGYCLASNNTDLLPVYYYSPYGSYDKNNSGNRFLLEEISIRSKKIKKIRNEKPWKLEKHKDKLHDREKMWTDLVAGSNISSAQSSGVEALTVTSDIVELKLTSQWNQGSPYNDRTPVNPPDRTVTGCVATATAQVMYYWKWPQTGVGAGSNMFDYWWRTTWDDEPLATNPGIPSNWGGGGLLEWTSQNGGRLRMNGQWDMSILRAAANINSETAYQNTLAQLWNRLNDGSTLHTANYGATTYDWNVMQDTHVDPPDPGDAQVAKLNYHLGIALEMDWGIWGSAASDAKIPPALADHFRYDQDAVYEIMDTTSIEKMTEEIDWLRPIVFSGCPGNGGECHAWVIYGYNKATDPARQFKMNMGWSGNSDGWYSIDNIDLNGDGTNEFNINFFHVTQLAPLGVIRFAGNTTPGDGTPDNPHQNIEVALPTIPDETTIILKGNSVTTIAGDSLIIDRPMTLKGINVVIQ